MIAAWMLYALAVSALLWAAARAADAVFGALRLPTRFVWALAMLSMLIIPIVGLVGRIASQPRGPRTPMSNTGVWELKPVFITTLETANPTAAPRASLGLRVDNSLNTVRALAEQRLGALRRFDSTSLDPWNTALITCWIVASLTVVGWLLATAARLRTLERSLPVRLVGGERVLVSNDVGPAVFGIIETRIVIPSWLLDLPQPSFTTILDHERSHADADDPALLYAALLLVALQPWNPALWFAIAGLRGAIETDCDQRVVRASRGSVADYMSLILSVYMRTATGAVAHTAFAARASNVARRFARLAHQQRRRALAVIGGGLSATACASTAWLIAAPNLAAAPMRARYHAVLRSADAALPKRSAAGVNDSGTKTEDSVEQIVPRVQNTATAPETVKPTPTRLEPCRSTPYPSGLAADNCEITGRIVLFAIDSSHVLVAYRDDGDTSVTAPYAIYGGPVGSVPNIRWRATGHARIRDHVLSIDNGLGQPMIALGTDANVLRTSYATTRAKLVVSMKAYLHDPETNWDALWELPSADRCNATYPLSPPEQPVSRDTAGVSTAPSRACVVREWNAPRVIKY